MKTPFGEIVIPVDESAPSKRGIDFGLDLAGARTHLHFLSVVDLASADVAAASGAIVDFAPIVTALEDAATAAGRAAVAESERRGVHADAAVVYGTPATAIPDFVRQQHGDALVIGTHARTGIARAFVGSVAERVIATSGIPVVVVHVDDARRTGPITVAVDGTPPSDRALALAIAIAHDDGRTLVLLHVSGDGDDGSRAAAAILERAAETVRSAGVTFESTMLVGHAPQTIVAEAERSGSSAIAIGTRGNTGLARLVLGSVAAAVLERAHVPVIVAPCL